MEFAWLVTRSVLGPVGVENGLGLIVVNFDFLVLPSVPVPAVFEEDADEFKALFEGGEACFERFEAQFE